ncbi:hypothetical protein [Pseudomonas fragi]|uniref:hypothetical protein n=1 Tax=Pseudomonas fragi TaxID=296 RepID=UPI00132FA7FA|nr:hypothetical protein [Pseudomonas fragi]NNB31945.1 hypothetical protein [Pseudomonas fragi]
MSAMEKNEVENIKFNEKPLICMVDMNVESVKLLESKNFNVTSASVGNPIFVNNNSESSARFIALNHNISESFHEFDVVVIDLCGEQERVPYRTPSDDYSICENYNFLYSSYPEKVFDPRPESLSFLGREVDVLLGKMAIVIVFAGQFSTAEYRTVKKAGGKSKFASVVTRATSDLYDGFPTCINRSGRRIKAAGEENIYSVLVGKYFNDAQYKLAFEHPTRFDSRRYAHYKVPEFAPIALNERDEVVSYSHKINNGVVFVFPQINNKGEFLAELFSSVFAEEYPQIFPVNEQFSWLDSGDYLVPGQKELMDKRVILEKQYLNNIEKNNADIELLKSEYGFLLDLVSETGDKLVEAVAHYLEWLEFDSVVNQDHLSQGVLEEDLQVEFGEKLIVVEIKGIGGTSTDKACSQITKIKNRRMKIRKSFDVFGLYIVNHERYISPRARKNPPFTDHQLEDAILDERGLLTTYQMYQAYFLINDGILSKEEVRNKLLGYGLVTLVPENLVCLGLPSELLMKNTVAVVDLLDNEINVGDVVVIKKNGSYKKMKVVSLQVDSRDVDKASGVQVGIKVDGKIENRSEIFLF